MRIGCVLGKYTNMKFPQGMIKAILQVAQEHVREGSMGTGPAGEALKALARGDDSWAKLSKREGRSSIGQAGRAGEIAEMEGAPEQRKGLQSSIPVRLQQPPIRWEA